MDPEVWDQPEEFRPERFLTAENKVQKPKHFMPFGSGQRMCLGDSLAEMELQLFFSSLMHVFDIQPPSQDELPSLEGIAGVTVKETTLKDAEADLSVAGVEQRHMLMQRLSRAPTTRVMVLRNMITADEIDGEVEAEVTEECENYGTVRKVVIYQEKQSAAADAEIIVKIFVEFSMPQDVQVI